MTGDGKGPFKGKVARFATSLVLPVDRGRTGECLNCGACCRFLVNCPFLRPVHESQGVYRCIIYPIRPLQCRKYPRAKKEQIHQPCGYRFEESQD